MRLQIALFAAATLSWVAAFAQIAPKTTPISLAASPIHIEASAEPGHTITQSIHVFTEGLGETLSVTVGDFQISPGGQGQFFKAGTLDRSAARWFSITPSVFPLVKNGSQEVALTVSVPADSRLHGTYWGIVFFNSTVRPSVGTLGVGTAGRVGVAVYINVGQGTVKAQAGNLKYTPQSRTFSYTFQNLGNTVLRPHPTLALVDQSGKRFSNLDLSDFPVLPGGVYQGTYVLPQTVQLPSGPFLGVLTFEYGDHKLIAAQGSFRP